MDHSQSHHLVGSLDQLVLVLKRSENLNTSGLQNSLPTQSEGTGDQRLRDESPLFCCNSCKLELTGNPDSDQGKILKNLHDNDALTCPECGGAEVSWIG
jgi:Zn finger protein HypA/HybF involved in hydrogenase expression